MPNLLHISLRTHFWDFLLTDKQDIKQPSSAELFAHLTNHSTVSLDMHFRFWNLVKGSWTLVSKLLLATSKLKYRLETHFLSYAHSFSSTRIPTGSWISQLAYFQHRAVRHVKIWEMFVLASLQTLPTPFPAQTHRGVYMHICRTIIPI